MTTQPTLKFQHNLPGDVWKTCLSTTDGSIGIEVRNHQSKKVYFFKIDSNGELHSFASQMTFSWWITIAGISEKHLILEKMNDPLNTEDRNLYAYDWQNSQMLWSKEGLIYQQHDENRLEAVLKTVDSMERVLLDLATGAQVNEQYKMGRVNTNIVEPAQFQEGTTEFDKIAEFILIELNVKARLVVDYVEAGGKMVLSYYMADKKGFSNFISVWNENGDCNLLELMEKGLKLPAQSSFFVLEKDVIFVQEKVKVKGYQLG